MQQEIEIGSYFVRFPIFIITSDEKYLTLLGARSSSGSTSVSVFTDEDSARTFNERSQSDKASYTVSFDVLGFLGLLEIIETRGFTHVTFDAYRWQGHVPLAIEIKNLRGKLLALYDSN